MKQEEKGTQGEREKDRKEGGREGESEDKAEKEAHLEREREKAGREGCIMLLKYLRKTCLLSSGLLVAPFPNPLPRGVPEGAGGVFMAVRGSGTTGLTLWKLNLKRSVLGAFTAHSMLHTSWSRDCLLIFPGDGLSQGNFLSGMSEFGEWQGRARCQGAASAFLLLCVLRSLWL